MKKKTVVVAGAMVVFAALSISPTETRAAEAEAGEGGEGIGLCSYYIAQSSGTWKHDFFSAHNTYWTTGQHDPVSKVIPGTCAGGGSTHMPV